MVNGARFASLPTTLKPIILLVIVLTMILGGSSHINKAVHPEATLSGGWFFWLTIVVQLVFMVVTVVFFALEIERLITCGRDAWPLAEVVYSVVFVIANIANCFIVAHWNKYSTNGTPIAAAFSCFALVILYAVGGAMNFRIWRGFVQSGAAQNPTAQTQPGNIQGMHPGI